MVALVLLKRTYRDDKIALGFDGVVSGTFRKVWTVQYDRESLWAQTESPTIELDLKFRERHQSLGFPDERT
ncbi:hypothetical protein [Bradyrhizobium sp. AZCC 1610]|uniref:hypothetical protein n=1 Tax=Bradyrhizobium sp. AZCC 1610 TaxID=3117020 RepID=UPI002FEFE9C0